MRCARSAGQARESTTPSNGLADFLIATAGPQSSSGRARPPVLALTYAFLGLVLEPNAALEKEATEWAGLLLAGTPLDRLRFHVSNLLTTRTGEPPPKRFLVYIDQGEELYARSTSEQRARFSSIIAEAAGHPEFQILSSLRSDYYGRLQDDLTLFNATERLDLLPMSANELTRAIMEPARRLSVRFEPADAPARLASLAAAQPGALPLLSDLMAELWRGMEQRGDGILSWRERIDLVDVGRPLSARADRYLAEQPKCKEAARALFTLRLAHVPVLGEPVRRRVLKSECTEEQWRIVETLSDQEWRLLTVSEDAVTHEPTVEVAHEQLLRSWTTLRDWLTESRDFFAWIGTLDQARLDWLAADGVENALLMGIHLMRAQLWRNDRGSDLSLNDHAFIKASEDREARAAQKEKEDKQRALTAQSRFMAQAAQNELKRGDYGTALALAIEALPRDVVSEDRPYILEVERALQDIIGHNTKELAVLGGHEGGVNSAVFSADGGRVLTASDDKTARLWEAASGEGLAVLGGHEGGVNSAVFSADGGRVLTASDDGTARLWEAASGKELAVLRGHEYTVNSAVFSADGGRVLTASNDGTARLWEAASGKELAVLRGHEGGGVNSAVFSADGTRVLTASADKTARLTPR
jgi:WD40 repeat protein